MFIVSNLHSVTHTIFVRSVISTGTTIVRATPLTAQRPFIAPYNIVWTRENTIVSVVSLRRGPLSQTWFTASYIFSIHVNDEGVDGEVEAKWKS